jgi:hypothetical protein
MVIFYQKQMVILKHIYEVVHIYLPSLGQHQEFS